MKKIIFFFISLISCTYIQTKAQSSLKKSNVIRLGTEYGGWTIPENFLTENSICYCAGAGEDISFDVALVENYSCDVYTIDPTPRAIKHFNYIKDAIKAGQPAYINNSDLAYKIDPLKIDNLHLLPIGLWDSNTTLKFYQPQNPAHVSHSILNLQKTEEYFEAECKKLSTIMGELGHTYIDLLKIDIEGAEYVVIESIIREKINIKCLCIEFDEFAGANKENNDNITASIEKTNRTISLLQEIGYEIIYQNGYTDMTFFRK